jgi:glycosyltransferase involved in cell wall biosynthesis
VATLSEVHWVTPFWPTRTHDGYGSFVFGLWEAVRQLSGVSCPVHLTSPLAHLFPPAASDLVFPLNGGTPWSYRARLDARLAAPLVRRRIHRLQSAPLHLHGARGLELLLSTRTERAVFLHVHGQIARDALSRLSGLGKLARRPFVVLAVSEHISEKLALKENFAEVHVIPNGYNSRLFYPSASETKSNTIRVLTVGNLAEHKNIGCVIKAIAVLSRSGIPASLKIVGVGPERRHLKLLSRQLDVARQVEFWGARPQAEVAQLMRESDVFALPSRDEAFGVVFKEALASGLPTIGGSGTGAVEAIGQAGVLVDPDAVEDLAEAIVVGHREGKRSPKDLPGPPSDWKASAEQLLAIYAHYGIS